jgi:EmrB/QacA subfamily drug resistance transporter
MEDSPSTTGRRGAERRVARGVVSSYVHQLSDRHRSADLPAAPAPEPGAGRGTAPASTDQEETRRGSRALWPTLVLACLAQFMVILDVSVVNVALPSIRTSLGFSEQDLQWVVNAYTVTFAGFLLLGGRAADLVGRRRVFITGLLLFALASLVGGVADSQGMLIGARAAQGLGAAVVSPASLSILTTTFREGAERNRALGAWGAMGGAGGSAGVLLGGMLTDLLSWRWILFINVPIGLAAAALSLRFVAAGRDPSRARNFDLAGAVTATLGLMVLVWAIVRTDVNGWGSAQTIGVMAAGVALIAVFLAIEGRLATAPLMPLRIFASRMLSGANATMFLLGAAMFGMWFFVSLYLQQVLGYSPLKAGLAFLPMTLTIVIGSTLASRAVARVGVKPLLVGGMLAEGVGLLLFATVSTEGSYLGDVLVPSLIVAAGIGLAFVPITIAAVAGVAPREAGLASGLVNTSRLMGGALGLAILATLATSRTDGDLRVGGGIHGALTDGFHLAFTVGAGFAFVGALVALLVLRQAKPRPPAQAHPEPAPLEATP